MSATNLDWARWAREAIDRRGQPRNSREAYDGDRYDQAADAARWWRRVLACR